MPKSGVEYRADIDGLRALAVTVVILFHLDVSWLPGGFVGVDVFFVISGFLITSLITRRIGDGSFSLIDFYERRFRRIYPNLIVILAATAILGWFTMMPETYRYFGRTLVWAALSASNFTFIGKTGYFDPGSIDKPLLHTWSLGVEEQFYLVFPWLLMLAARRGHRTASIIAGAVVLSLALSIGAGMMDWAPSYFLLPTRFWELGLGALVAVLPLNDYLTPFRRTVLGLAGLAGILWACLFLSESASFPGYVALAPALGAAALIVANGGPVNMALALPPLAWIGRLSYALYLWHWPLITVAAGIGFSAKETSTRIGVVALSLLLSFIGYHLWEMPIRRRRLLSSRRILFAALSVCVAILVGAGICIFIARGFSQRLPKELFEVYENTKETSRHILKKCPRDETKPYACPIGSTDTDHISFMVFGDSHADVVGAEIGDIADQYGLRGLFVGESGCRLLIEPVTETNKICVMQNEFSKEQYKKYKPDLVIIVNYWPPLEEENGYIKDNKIDLENNIFEKTLEFFEGTKVVVPLTVPVHDTFVSKVSWHSWFRSRLGLPVEPNPTISMGKYRQQQAPVQALLDTEKRKHPNLSIVDPAPVLCPQGICISIIDNRPLYYDQSHLSHKGALLYAPLFRPYFEDLSRQLAAPH